eukprot:1622908-Alexandrium_andersonii.AAC.1
MSASLVGSEMCIRDRSCSRRAALLSRLRWTTRSRCLDLPAIDSPSPLRGCLLYTSDAADDM